MSRPELKLILFTKAPEPGATKTRLIPALGQEGAAELHKRMCKHMVDTVCDGTPYSIELQCHPNTQHVFFTNILRQHPRMALTRQQGSHLGERMAAALQHALAQYRHAIIIGTDVPALTTAYLQDAFARLEAGTDVVIGPAEDGGYVLIGLSIFRPELFSGIDWGTGLVLQQTLDRTHEAGMSAALLPALWDVDTPDDLDRIRNSNQLSFLLNYLPVFSTTGIHNA